MVWSSSQSALHIHSTYTKLFSTRVGHLSSDLSSTYTVRSPNLRTVHEFGAGTPAQNWQAQRFIDISMMKTSYVAASVLAAALVLLAIPTSAQPTETDVFNSINQWISDVDQVNNFLNIAASLSDPTGAAANTKQISLDEPVQLGILSSVPGLSDQANNAVLLLQEVFGNVPTDLQNIVDDPSPSNVQTQLTGINNVRCLNVLPSLDILWPAAAAAVGAPVPPPANRPDACATISRR